MVPPDERHAQAAPMTDQRWIILLWAIGGVLVGSMAPYFWRMMG
jgi:hypothetical protein